MERLFLRHFYVSHSLDWNSFRGVCRWTGFEIASGDDVWTFFVGLCSVRPSVHFVCGGGCRNWWGWRVHPGAFRVRCSNVKFEWGVSWTTQFRIQSCLNILNGEHSADGWHQRHRKDTPFTMVSKKVIQSMRLVENNWCLSSYYWNRYHWFKLIMMHSDWKSSQMMLRFIPNPKNLETKIPLQPKIQCRLECSFLVLHKIRSSSK